MSGSKAFLARLNELVDSGKTGTELYLALGKDQSLAWFYNSAETAEILRMSETSLRALRHKNLGPQVHRMPGSTPRYDRQSICAYLSKSLG